MARSRLFIPSETSPQKCDWLSLSSILSMNYKYYFLSLGLKNVYISVLGLAFFLLPLSFSYTHPKKLIKHSPEAKTLDFSFCLPYSTYSGDLQHRLLVYSHHTIHLPLQTKILPSSVEFLIMLHRINFIYASERGLKRANGRHFLHLATQY